MKTTKYTLIAALAIFSAACQKENVHTDSAQEVIINATIEKSETKTVLGEGFTGTDGKVHHKVLWHANESISLFDAVGNNHRFTAYDAKDTETANFKHNAGDGYTALDAFEPAEKFYCVYPAHKSHSFDATTKVITYYNLSTTQKAVKDGFDDDLAIALGVGGETYQDGEDTRIKMTFKNVTALAKFEVVGNGVKQITLLNKVSRKIGGKFTIDCSGDDFMYSAGGSDRIHLNNFTSDEESKWTANDLEEGIYYITLIPGAFRPRVRIYSGDINPSNSTINDNTYKCDISGSSEIDLKPGMILDLGKWNSNGRVVE